MRPDGELRCTARHPDQPGRECRNLIGVQLAPGSVILHGADYPGYEGCVRLRCDRCGAEYVACPARRSA